MKVGADSSVLVRVAVNDDEEQADRARQALRAATMVAVSNTALCEFVWVMSRGYKVRVPEIVEAVRRLLSAGNVVANRPAIEMGLRFLASGADFTDGIIAYEGRELGAELFLSFDRAAIAAAHMAGMTAAVPISGS